MNKFSYCYFKSLPVFFLACFFCMNFAGALANTVQFSNFSGAVILSEYDSRYVLIESGQVVEITNRLIVKASKDLAATAIQSLVDQSTSISSLYDLQHSRYWLLKVSSINDLAETIKQLQRSHTIELVQPDIQQITIKTERRGFDREQRVKRHYFEMLGLPANGKLGRGVAVAVIDDGFDFTHSSLSQVDISFKYDTESRSLTASPVLPQDTHGTQVAGVIFSKGGVVEGVAPKASMIAIRQPNTWTSETLLSFQLAKLNKADVINCSWHTNVLLEPIADVVNDLATNGREGKGAVVVFAAGNEGEIVHPGMSEASIDAAFVIGSSTLKGKRKKFSNFGASVDFYVYGGGYKTTSVDGKYNVFGGTSLSSAIMSGLVANIISNDPGISIGGISDTLSTFLKGGS